MVSLVASTVCAGGVSIVDGGSVDSQRGSIVNNGTIDPYKFFRGDIAAITGYGSPERPPITSLSWEGAK